MRIVFFCALMLAGFSAHTQTTQAAEGIVYHGFDSFGNDMITLELLPDFTYSYTEKFLDGSSLIDTGMWEIKKGVLSLWSDAKVVRKHHYQTYKKAYKFKRTCFELTGEVLQPQSNTLSKDNAYLTAYVFRKN